MTSVAVRHFWQLSTKPEFGNWQFAGSLLPPRKSQNICTVQRKLHERQDAPSSSSPIRVPAQRNLCTWYEESTRFVSITGMLQPSENQKRLIALLPACGPRACRLAKMCFHENLQIASTNLAEHAIHRQEMPCHDDWFGQATAVLLLFRSGKVRHLRQSCCRSTL